MATLVSFHAHPDDEAIATGGSMAKAAAAGHRVVLVVATRGDQPTYRGDVVRVDGAFERAIGMLANEESGNEQADHEH